MTTSGQPSDDGLRGLISVFAPLGWRAIGGPTVHVQLMEREVVRRRRWVDRESFSRMFAACSLLPGPTSTQLALLIGLRRARAAGMLVTALLFIGPAVLVMLGLGELYLHVGSADRARSIFLGVDAAVVGMVARAALDLSVLAKRGLLSVAIAAGALGLGVAGVNPIAVLAGGGAVAVIAWLLRERRGALASSTGGRMVIPFLSAAHLPIATAGMLLLTLTFLKIGAVAFGSGYVLLPFLHADFVGGSFHLTDRQVADAFAVSQITPGPVYAVAAFLGVQIAGVAGGIVAAIAIFAPSLVYVPLLGSVVRITDRYAAVRAALEGVTVAALGLIASVCVTLGRIALVGPIQVATAAGVFALLWRWPRAQPVAVGLGILGGVLIGIT